MLELGPELPLKASVICDINDKEARSARRCCIAAGSGGLVVILTRFPQPVNFCPGLTRRREVHERVNTTEEDAFTGSSCS